MHFDERRAHFLQDRLQRRLKECQLDSFYSYYRLLVSDKGKNEMSLLVENLTVNETSFFRNKSQMELFHKHLLDAHQMGFAAGELIAHVNYMLVEGRLTAAETDGVLHFRTT